MKEFENMKTISWLTLLSIIIGTNISPSFGQNSGAAVHRNRSVFPLNSGDGGTWSLTYGPQDKNAPMNPEELKKSGRETISATVPGNVELDLMNAGKISDPMVGNNVYSLRKYETYQWWYHWTFKVPDIPIDHRIELCFDGIDCIAEIWLNNRKIGTTENMFIAHRFDITDLIRERNELFVCIFSPILEARQFMRESLGPRADALPEAVNIRKAPHMYGWDILPRVVSAGLWKDVRLESIPPTRWKSVYWITRTVDVGNRAAEVLVDWEFDTDRNHIDDMRFQIVIEREGKPVVEESYPVYTTCGRNRITLTDVDFWWPRGYGEPALYTAKVRLIDPDGSVLDERTDTIGIRKAELIRTEINTKENPGEFVFRINGVRIFVRGTNWVALDAIHSRDRMHLGAAMGMLVDLNCNMVRCWGGNVYESDAFFNLCDENGIMIWQDFAMACTIYPQNQRFADKIRKEAKTVILRLRNHPALVLWAGNNENDVSLTWGGEQTHIDPNTDIISRQVLPSLIRQWDPERPYLPSSPYISPEAFKLKNRIDPWVVPEAHLWGPRGYYKEPFYNRTNARFVSEIGYHGCPNRGSLEKMMDKDFVYPWTDDGTWNDQWQTKAVRTHPYATVSLKRNDLMINQIRCLFGDVPSDLDTFITASQIVQAEAMKYFIEYWRMSKFDKTGILWWNLRDGWPVISDAIVDYYNSKKLAYYYIKRVQTDICAMIGDAEKGRHPVVVVNDTRNGERGRVTVRDAATKDVVFNEAFSIGTNGKTTAGYIPEPGETTLWLIEWEVSGKTYFNHYLAFHPTIELNDYLEWLNILRAK
jgi:beta-mannosidase